MPDLLTWAFQELSDSAVIIENWKRVGYKLGVSDGDIAAINANNQDAVKNKCFEMLSTWKNRQSHATIDMLITALDGMEYRALATKLRDEKKRRSSTVRQPVS